MATLSEIRSPSAKMLGSEITAEGYFHTNAEEDILARDPELHDLVELSFAPMLVGVPKGEGFARRTVIVSKFSGKVVRIRGRLRVGPFGMLNIAMVYLDVEDIELANHSPDPTPALGMSPAGQESRHG